MKFIGEILGSIWGIMLNLGLDPPRLISVPPRLISIHLLDQGLVNATTNGRPFHFVPGSSFMNCESSCFGHSQTPSMPLLCKVVWVDSKSGARVACVGCTLDRVRESLWRHFRSLQRRAGSLSVCVHACARTNLSSPDEPSVCVPCPLSSGRHRDVAAATSETGCGYQVLHGLGPRDDRVGRSAGGERAASTAGGILAEPAASCSFCCDDEGADFRGRS